MRNPYVEAPMLRILITLAALICLSAPLQAQCVGKNLITALPAEDRAVLDALTAKVPHPVGNYWRATKGDQTITLIGSYHFDDPRHTATMAAVTPMITTASTVLVEAGPEEEKALKSQIAGNPGLMIITDGPTLIEQLPAEDWAALTTAMRARGVPAFMAAKFQPWYISVMLGIPPCAMAQAATAKGLDGQIIDAATTAGVPIKALEPFDTVFEIFGGLSNADQLSMIHSTLAMENLGADYAITLADTYFSQDTRAIWEFTRLQSLAVPGATPDQVNGEFARMEEALMARRNRSWIPVIKAAAEQGPVFAAFGALHLSGTDGVLALLEREGYTLERLTFPQ
jgi:uncharacterized protein